MSFDTLTTADLIRNFQAAKDSVTQRLLAAALAERGVLEPRTLPQVEKRYPNLPMLDHGGESHGCACNPDECLGCWFILNHGVNCEDNDYQCCESQSCPDGCACETPQP